MTDAETIYYDMFKMVSHVMHKNETIWSGNQIIVDCVAQLDNTILDIDSANEKLGKTTKIITVGKTSLRKSITNQAFLIKENQRLYYKMNNNIEEMQLLIYPITKLNRMTDSDFYLEATHIYEKAVVMATQLIPYSITTAMIEKLKADLDKYFGITPERELQSQVNANLIKLLPVKIDECRLMLKNIMGTLVHNYKATNKEFVNAFDNSRIRHKRPGSHKHYTIVIKGKTTQSNKTNPLAEVNVIAGKQKKTTTTDIDGNYTIKIYTKDADTVTFTHPEFETLIQPINLINPEKHKKATYTINAVMVKNSTYSRFKK